MAQQTKIVTIEPSEAAAAGCSARCTSYVDDKTREETFFGGDKAYRTFTNYKIEAFAPIGGLWIVKRIIYTQNYTNWDGTPRNPEIFRFIAPTNADYYMRPSSLSTEYETTPYEYTTIVPTGKTIVGWLSAGLSDIQAEFEFIGARITITIDDSMAQAYGCTATGAGEYPKNTTVQLVASAATGYAFDGWYLNGSKVSSNAYYSYTATSNKDFVAKFTMVNPVTVTLVARYGWGQVCFAGETPTTGTVSKTVPAGTSITIEATKSDSADFIFWLDSGGSGRYYNDTLTISPTSNVTWTAYFGYVCTAWVAKVGDVDTRIPVGNVRFVYTGGTSIWAHDITIQVVDGPTISVEQQSLGGGWSFVKWRYKIGTAGWVETSSSTLSNISLDHLQAIALFSRTPTHLLVNSSTKESPAKLVYDPATNLLVADY